MATSPSHTPAGTQTYSKRRHVGAANVALAAHAVDCWTWDTTNVCWLDFCAGLGPVILGHRHPDVDAAVQRQVNKGVCFSLPTRLEERVAARLSELIPCADMTRFLKNGADALEAAVRVARAVTGRDAVLRCGYHGMHDWCIESRGIPAPVRNLTVPVSYCDLQDLRQKLFTYQPAALVIEPVVAGNPVMPDPAYLPAVRMLCDEFGTLLVFDEVVTGFRMDLGGAQTAFGVTPDLAAFSKAMANGYPISALCGRTDLMRELERGVFVSTTFGGDPIGLAAAEATLTVLADENVLPQIGAFGLELRAAYDIGALSTGLATQLIGYPQRWLARWDNPAQERAFNDAVAAHHVLAPGYYNLMYAHVQHRERVLEQLTTAWAAGFAAARAIG